MKPMKRKDFIRMIEKAGWVKNRGTEHDAWEKAGVRFAVPRHTVISPGVVRSWHTVNKSLEED